jgi:hypothetical protein
MHAPTNSGTKLCLFALPALALSFAVTSASAAQKPAGQTQLAQKIVNDAHSKHPEAAEIGVATIGANGCSTIASSDKSDLGEKCEKEDSEPITSGKPYVEKEGANFDVTLPLHDSSGKLVGSVGIELKPSPGQSQADVVQQAQKIASEMEASIPSKASLTRPF